MRFLSLAGDTIREGRRLSFGSFGLSLSWAAFDEIGRLISALGSSGRKVPSFRASVLVVCHSYMDFHFVLVYELLLFHN